MAGGVAGVLITGVYGTGKSTLAEEIANILEARRVAFGALDLDWLGWFGAPRQSLEERRAVFLRNLAAVASNYRGAGVMRLVLAGAVRDREQLMELEAAIGVPLRVVRLVVSSEEITRRLESHPTVGRLGDLEVARQWLADRVGEGIEDRVAVNDGPIGEVAAEVLDWLGW